MYSLLDNLDDVIYRAGGLNDGLFQKRWTSADNRRSIVTLPSGLSAVCIAQNCCLAASLGETGAVVTKSTNFIIVLRLIVHSKHLWYQNDR